jgi:hypothetical protein
MFGTELVINRQRSLPAMKRWKAVKAHVLLGKMRSSMLQKSTDRLRTSLAYMSEMLLEVDDDVMETSLNVAKVGYAENRKV